jgi:tRNA pseudouridine32 synthase/23S rRNA pseudouridine746 synthase
MDQDLLVLNKPSGLLSVPGRGEEKQDSLVSRVLNEFPEALVVHRLDMETSGLIIIARNPETRRALGRAFEKREVDKTYVAVVIGKIEPANGLIDLPLICDWPNRPRQMVDHSNGKPSVTRYRTLDYLGNNHTSRIELKPETGRSHQLRVHLQSIGHPILGDALYADDRVLRQAPRLQLHATSLRFTHPTSKNLLQLESRPPF